MIDSRQSTMTHTTALLIIDVQTAILEGAPLKNEREVLDKFSDVLARINRLLVMARASKTPVIYVQHDGGLGDPLETGTPGWRIHPQIAPLADETIIHKRSCDSFHETSLQETLQDLGIRRLVVAGCMTQYCVDTSCRRAVSMGYDLTLAADAHTTVDDENLSVHQIVAHHNRLLDGFNAGPHVIDVRSVDAIQF
jgi:nicotinamidase-related amidase